MKCNVTLAAGLAIGALMSADDAPAAGRPGFYGGGGYGQSSFAFHKDRIDEATSAALESVGLTEISTTSQLDNDGTGYEFMGGSRFLPWLAAELGYLALGQAEYRAGSDVEFPEEGVPFPLNTKFDVDVSGLTLTALGIWPVSERFDLYVRGGFMLGDSKVSVRLATEDRGSVGGSGTQSHENLLWGAGVAVSFLDIYAARLEYRQILDVGDTGTVGKSDVDFVTLGFIVAF